MLARQATPAALIYEEALQRLSDVARPLLRESLGFEPTPTHEGDIVADLTQADPATLAAFLAKPNARADDPGLKGLVRAALSDRMRARPFLFAPLCSRVAFLRTAAAERLGTPSPGERHMRSIENEFDLSGADGTEGLRRTHRDRCERLAARGLAKLIDRTPHSTGARLLGDNDEREAAARAGLPVPGAPTVGASRAHIPNGRFGQIAGGAKPHVPMTTLFDHAGELHSVPVSKAGDYVRLRGWRRPIDVVAQPTASTPDPETDDTSTAPVAPPAPAHTVSTLSQLREEAAGLGIEVSANWGVARLRAEIAGAATSLSTASPDDASEQPVQEMPK